MGKIQGTATLELADFLLINEQLTNSDKRIESLNKEIEENHKFIASKIDQLDNVYKLLEDLVVVLLDSNYIKRIEQAIKDNEQIRDYCISNDMQDTAKLLSKEEYQEFVLTAIKIKSGQVI